MSVMEEIMPLTWWAICGLLVLIVVLLLISLMMNRKIKRFEQSYLSLQTYVSGKNLDVLLEEYIGKVDRLQQKQIGSEEKIKDLEEKQGVTLDKAEVMRFSAFEKGGSDMSFALALLNRQGDGVVLTSIQTREDSRIYAKPVTGGKSDYSLSGEEEKVINKALQTMS